MTENTQKLMTFGKQLRTFENGYVDLLIQRKWSLIKPIKCHIKGIGKKKKIKIVLSVGVLLIGRRRTPNE